MDRSFSLQTLAGYRGEEAEPPRRSVCGVSGFLCIPQESSVFRSNPLYVFPCCKSNNLLENSQIKKYQYKRKIAYTILSVGYFLFRAYYDIQKYTPLSL
jgi:hypothetical protein